MIITAGIVMFSPPEASALGAPPKSEIRITALAPAFWAWKTFVRAAAVALAGGALEHEHRLAAQRAARQRVAELRVGRGLVARIGGRIELATVEEVVGEPAGGQVGAPVLLDHEPVVGQVDAPGC